MIRARKHDTIRLHLKSGRSLEGVLLRAPFWWRRVLVLEEARVETDEGGLVRSTGAHYVDRVNVDFMQRVQRVAAS